MKSNLKNSEKKEISIVVPLYNEAQSLNELTQRIRDALTKFEYEIIFIDDGSDDESWQVIQQLSDDHSQVQGIRFRKNNGKSDALQTGFEYSSARYVVTMDADL